MDQKKAKNSDKAVGRTSCEHCGKTILVPLEWDEMRDLAKTLDGIGKAMMHGLVKIASMTEKEDHAKMAEGAKMIIDGAEDLFAISRSLNFILKANSFRSKVGGVTEEDKKIMGDEARRSAAERN